MLATALKPKLLLFVALLALLFTAGSMMTVTPAQAHDNPDCSSSTYRECINLYMDHWFEELEADDDTHGEGTRAQPVQVNDDGSIGLSRGYHIRTGHFFNGDDYRVRVKEAYHERMLRGADSPHQTDGYTNKVSLSNLLVDENEDASMEYTYGNVGAISGKAYHRVTVVFEYQRKKDGSFTNARKRNTKRSRSSVVNFVDARCSSPSNTSDAHWRVTYLENRDTGGSHDHRIDATYPNPLTCGYADWAKDGKAAGVYQRQVCRGDDCTAPYLTGTGVYRSTLSERYFNDGVRKLDGTEPTGTTYHVMDRKGKLSYFNTGSTRFTKATWDNNPALRQRFSVDNDDTDRDETAVYYLLTKCTGFDCSVPEAVQGRNMASKITQ